MFKLAAVIGLCIVFASSIGNAENIQCWSSTATPNTGIVSMGNLSYSGKPQASSNLSPFENLKLLRTQVAESISFEERRKSEAEAKLCKLRERLKDYDRAILGTH